MPFNHVGKFRCCTCGFVFRVDPGISGCNVVCPKDQTIYCEWIDWQRFVNEATKNRGW